MQFRSIVGRLLQINKFQHVQNRTMMKHSINHILNKKVLDRYLRLPLPPDKIMATYVWIDGTGINLRSKDRILRCLPSSVEGLPDWAFDGSSTGQAETGNSDTKLLPCAMYNDPFRMYPHIIVMCEVYSGADGKPAKTNFRHMCKALCDKFAHEEPWFGLEQEYTMCDVDGWGLGWPKGGGLPFIKYELCYCGCGSKYVVGRDMAEAHQRACLYANMDFEGTNAEVTFCGWEWQIGTSKGIKAPDDLWGSRYLMSRISEEFGVMVTYHPKPFGYQHPGMGMHHNFSCKTMRTAPGGWKFIEGCVKRLEKNHMKHMVNYGADESTNRMRLSGKFETAPFDKFSWGIASRKASIRIGRTVKEKDQGFMEDRRPAADCDPYHVCGLLLQTCLGEAGQKS